MASASPLFQSSIDLFSHAIEHFNLGTERDRKFVIMHLANAVELIFKDLMLDLGLSIYKNPKETITITSAIEILTKEKNIKIRHLNKLELLIDERNALQHRYGFPNELTTIFYMENTYHFFKDFLHQNYSLDIDDILEDFLNENDLALFNLRNVNTQPELEKLIKLTKIHPVGALLSAYAYVEKQTEEIREIIVKEIKDGEKGMPYLRLHYFNTDTLLLLMDEYGIPISNEEKLKITEFKNARNQVAHGRDTVDNKMVIEFIETIKSLDPKIKNLKEKVTKEPRQFIEREKDRIGKRRKIQGAM